ncbi:MAG: glycerophosphodiester phosphodiesterase [Deltaproteobacteria bacterium]|nr:glycerophosphodiester phosphodiesterase [Deltaproteobacteria bacterium]MBI3388896.1 glycerophosphodiester phosphodiesterase [Deltaproteobacteria bacterium]
MQLVWHMARATRHEPPNTVAGIDAALAAGAQRIEIDVRLLADADALLSHDRQLADGRSVRALTAAQVHAEALPTLSQAVQRIADSGALLQVDLKDEGALTPAEIQRVADLVAPLGERVIVGSMIDWNLRALRAAAPSLQLGFDPLLYFHHWENRPTEVPFPRQRGAYEYWDDHPLATVPMMPVRDYVMVRLGALQATVPRLDEVMLHYPTLLRAIHDGVDVVAFFHAHSTKVLAWTLDADTANAAHVFAQLSAAGVDTLVTNTPREFARRA